MRKLKHYRTIFEFQDDFPSGRSSFVRTLSNEEIDELIDLSSNIQGKIFYSKFKKPETVFSFMKKDAWGRLISSVRVLDGKNTQTDRVRRTG